MASSVYPLHLPNIAQAQQLLSISSAAPLVPATLGTHLDYRPPLLAIFPFPHEARKALSKNVNQIIGVFVFLFIAFPIILKNKSI